jgi:hypothetical protein
MAAIMNRTHVGGGQQIDRDVELLRRVMEAKARQPVEFMLEQGYMGRSARVYFRTWGVYLMLDVESLRYGYGDAQIHQMADNAVREAERHIKHKDQRILDEAYRSMASYEPDFCKPDPRNKPKEKKNAVQKRFEEVQQQARQAPVGSYSNPLRVELQKKVDAWLQ